MSRLRVGIDCDGVLYNWLDATCKVVGLPPYGEYGSPSWTHIIGAMGQEKWADLWKDHYKVRAMFEDGLPLQGAVDGVKRVLKSADVFLVTDRPEGARAATMRWLGAYRLNVTGLLFSKPNDKAEIVTALRLAAFVDDKPETVEILEANTPTRSYLMRKRHNEEFKWAAARTVTHLGQFADEVEAMLDRKRADREGIL